MQHLLFHFVAVLVVCGAGATPGLDLPRELVMDVNKPPFPVVNIIAEGPSVPEFEAKFSKTELMAQDAGWRCVPSVTCQWAHVM